MLDFFIVASTCQRSPPNPCLDHSTVTSFRVPNAMLRSFIFSTQSSTIKYTPGIVTSYDFNILFLFSLLRTLSTLFACIFSAIFSYRSFSAFFSLRSLMICILLCHTVSTHRTSHSWKISEQWCKRVRLDVENALVVLPPSGPSFPALWIWWRRGIFGRAGVWSKGSARKWDGRRCEGYRAIVCRFCGERGP